MKIFKSPSVSHTLRHVGYDVRSRFWFRLSVSKEFKVPETLWLWNIFFFKTLVDDPNRRESKKTVVIAEM